MTIYQNINRLVSYALETELITREDIIYTQNKLLDLFKLDGFASYEEAKKLPIVQIPDLENILAELLEYATKQGLADGSSTADKDLFDTRIMGLLVPPPSVVRSKFRNLYAISPMKATDWYYTFSKNTDYIRRYRVCKDLKWKTTTEYGDIDITINLSKPEKDPKKIAAARFAKKSGYPACLLCPQTEGYNGASNRVARETHRIIPLRLAGEDWGFQYSPYVYYNEHCIVFNMEHSPMKIYKKTFEYLFDFVEQFPHYTIGSNADLPIVGGSILTHNHFQGGRYEFAMARAPIETPYVFKGYEDISAGIVKWPMSVIRLDGKDKTRLIDLSDKILQAWRSYTDKDAFIFAETEGEPHNTITPIARRRGDVFEIDLVLRNNITTKEHPLGVYHPHAELHHIKKENIGLIEVMGLAVLPSRLKNEMELVEQAILEHKDIRSDQTIAKHADWVEEFLPKYNDINKDTISEILRNEIGLVFSKVLENAGVYKQDDFGQNAFIRFVKTV
ncbi:MAG: galactose-1-phosphate uridylyltransferase [Treponema sp. CETP13]|nr:MAG: galactose-1-phosphate uridylyltransferase [Treponema sp. CETP13]